MERLTFEGDFCDISGCREVPVGVYCKQDNACSRRQVWERLKEFEDAEESGLLVRLPCKVGDTAWAVRNNKGVKIPMPGVVAEMYFTQDMRLIVRVHGVRRGEVGKSVFLSLEDAEAALKKG